MENDKAKTRAKNNAYILLRARPRSEQEIGQRLKLKGYDDAVIDGVVDDLKRTGNIDDAKFARFWIESRMHMNPMGDVILKHELKLKGISDSVIEATLQDKAKNYDEYEVAFSMAIEKYKRFQKLDKRKALKRVYDFLFRRGFKYDTIRKITEDLAGKGSTPDEN
ncbi:MAG: regulatory protein RecX [Candidatus Omnitrophota bacterium]|nr:regulatory protein RecX [Candidatus Omnitrophota bacterium]